MAKLFLEDLELKGKSILIRVDFNVPLDEKGKITDDTRIREALPTIRYVVDRGGKAILISHLGRPEGRVVDKLRMDPVAERLEELLGRKVIKANDCIGDEVKRIVQEMKEGEILLLENVRFHKEEEENEEGFARSLAELADLFINDAFGTAHRAHASTVGVTKFLPLSAAGFLLKKEMEYLGMILENPQRPFVAILGGAKISGKIQVIENLLKKVDKLLIGGGMAFTFLKAQGKEIGRSLLEGDKLDLAQDILKRVKSLGVELLLPLDHVVVDRLSADADTKVVKVGFIPRDWEGVDIGPETVKLFSGALKNAKTVFWNGPLGVFEIDKFAQGTIAIAKFLTGLEAVTIIGGGDSIAAIQKAGVTDKITHVSTGGGASLEFVAGKVLPAIAALTDKK